MTSVLAGIVISGTKQLFVFRVYQQRLMYPGLVSTAGNINTADLCLPKQALTLFVKMLQCFPCIVITAGHKVFFHNVQTATCGMDNEK